MVGDEKSQRPIRPGAKRGDVFSLVGTPEHFLSPDQISYSLLTERAVWIYPLFLSDFPAQLRAYVLRLTFDDQMLVRWEMAQADEDRNPGWAGYHAHAPEKAETLLKQGKVSSATLSTKP